MDKHELMKTAVTAIIAVFAKELLSWCLTTSKKLAHHRQEHALSTLTKQETIDPATAAPPTTPTIA